jgi:acetolactate synthase small subunit
MERKEFIEKFKKLEECNKKVKLAVKNNYKLYGYKAVSGILYKPINDILFQVKFYFEGSFEKITLKDFCVRIICKPLILDEIFWKIIKMEDTGKKTRLSFHVNALFAARPVNISKYLIEFNIEDIEKTVIEEMKKANNVIDEYSKKIYDLNTFYEFIKNEPEEYLNRILVNILNKKYKKALEECIQCINENKNGGYVNGNTNETIITYIKEYIEKIMV